MAKSKKNSKKAQKKEEESDEEQMPEITPAESEEEEEDSVYDSDVPDYENPYADDDDDDDDDNGSDEDDDSDEEDEFEEQGSSDEEDLMEKQDEEEDEYDDEMDGAGKDIAKAYESKPREWKTGKRTQAGEMTEAKSNNAHTAKWMHTDDLSSDDEDDDGNMNRIGRVPLHWYEEFDHIGYNAHGKKVIKSASLEGGDRVDQALAHADNRQAGKFVVQDFLNDKNVQLTERQLELIRRLQNGAYAHPEFDGNAEYIDYFSGVDPELSGLNSNRTPEKSKFQPSKWEKLQVDRLLKKLEQGKTHECRAKLPEFYEIISDNGDFCCFLIF